MFLGPETSQETLKKPKSRPRDTQGPPKRHAKRCQKIQINASVVKNASSRRTHFRRFLGQILVAKIAVVCHHILTFCVNFSGNFWNPFWGPLLDQIGPREAKMNPRGPSRASKSQKPAFSQKWFSH